MKVSAVVTFASLLAATLNGASVWVDGRMPDYSGHDGSSEALAFKTIQEAVAAASAGDTVKVKPGVYDSGETTLPATEGGNLVRVMVDKKLRIESTDGAAATHIVGAEDPDGKETNAAARRYGLGDKAVRCVSVLEAGAGTVIKGFTIRGGRSRYDGNANQASTHAGGIKGAGQDTYVVDCVVSNCVATRGGAARDITAVRTLFQGNIAVNNGGSTTRFSRHYACLFINNGLEHSAVSLSAISDASAVVNCSLVGNGHGSISIEGNVATKVHNTLTILNRLDYPSISISGNISKSPDLSHVICDKCANDATGATRPTMTKVSTVLGQDHKTLVSPFDGDWRPVRYGTCDGTGDPALASPSWVPEEFRGFDFHGQPLVRANGTVNVGAVSAVGDAEGGVMFFSSSTTYAVDGYAKSLATGAPMYVRAGNGPKQVCVRVVDTLFCMSQSGAWTWSRFPDANNEIWMTLPPPGDVVTNVAISATATLYVDPKGSDANDGSSPTAGANNVGPKKTLAKAVAAAKTSDTTIIWAAAGTYDEETIAACGWTNRVYLDRNVFLRGAGADKTTIKGHYDGSDPSDRGCGPTAVRCVCAVNSSSYQTCVSGFTLADGCVNGGLKAGNSDPYKGGAFYCGDYGYRGQLIDCVITNCSGSRGVVFGGWLQRCLVTGCGPIGDLSDKRGSESLRKLCLSSCVVRDNNANRGGYFIVANDTCLLVNNTFIGNGTHAGYGDIADSVTMALNCVTVDKELKPISSGYGLNNYQNNSNAGQNGYVYAADLRLVDKANRDLRPCADSPLVGGGTVGDSKVVSSRTTAQWFSILSVNGFDGAPTCFVDGKPVAGAYQKPLPVVSVEAKLAGDLSPVGVTPWADGGTVTVTATGDEKRQFLGFRVDGELVPAAGRSYTYTMAPGFYRPTPVVISAVYSSDWYVNADPAKGRDINDGWTPETPKRTLIAAMQGPVAGDTVHAAAGVYGDGDGTIADGSGSTTKCRVNVPAGVTLRGDDRDGTIIEGKAPSSPDKYGLGADAVRGVYLSANAKLCNLTVRKGYTKNGNLAAESYGGGVLGANRTTCFVEDCTIRDCYGSRSGGGHSVTFNRCRLLDNYGASTGAAGRGCSYYNTYISGCKGNYRPMQDSTAFINCTYANDATDSEIVDPFQGANVTVANSVFLCDKVQLKSNVVSLKNVVFLKGGGVAMKVSTVANVTTNTAAEIALDDNGCPLPGSVLIDAGDDAQLDVIGDLDCDGGQRVYNGTIDIGCCERDWRGRYGVDVGATVTAASPEVVEREIDGANRVFLPSGEMRVAWGLGVGVCGRITVQVTGNGVLEMYVGDDEEPSHWWTAGSPELYKWRSTVADANLRFRYLPGEGDTGGAYVKSFETRGMTLILR